MSQSTSTSRTAAPGVSGVQIEILRVRSSPHCEQQAMRDEGVIYVAGHPFTE